MSLGANCAMPVDERNDEMYDGFSFAMLSNVGRMRSGNEDFCAADPEQGLFIVCDGMGGAAAGEVASELAATTFLAEMQQASALRQTTEQRLRAAVKAANTAVHERAAKIPAMLGMGTTLVTLFLEHVADDHARTLWLTHVGDSRCYRMRAGKLTAMTVDHSLVQEQVNAGQLTREEAERSPMRNIITRAIGSTPRVEAEVQVLAPEVGDLYLLNSDGLTRDLSDDDLARCLRGEKQRLAALCEALIDAANEAGGGDNITVLLVRIEE